MEYLDGQPLARVLNGCAGRRRWTCRCACASSPRCWPALDYAHELADYDGTPLASSTATSARTTSSSPTTGGVKLVDFGIAKNLASAHQTRPGVLKGKVTYMAPEQFLGRPSDRRADIFSVGVMLWEMLAGRRFWNGASDGEIASHLVSDRPLPPLPRGAGLPAGVEAICARALERDRKRRYATAAEMEAELEQVLTGANYAFERPLGPRGDDGLRARARAAAAAGRPSPAAGAQRQLFGVTMRTGERSMPASQRTGERVTPVVTPSAMSRTVVMPPPPPPPRARTRAQARVTSLRRTLWSVALGVAVAAPLAAAGDPDRGPRSRPCRRSRRPRRPGSSPRVRRRR